MHLKLRLLKATTENLQWRHKKTEDSLSERVEFRMIRVNDFSKRYSTLKVAVLSLYYNNPLRYKAIATSLPEDCAINNPVPHQLQSPSFLPSVSSTFPAARLPFNPITSAFLYLPIVGLLNTVPAAVYSRLNIYHLARQKVHNYWAKVEVDPVTIPFFLRSCNIS